MSKTLQTLVQILKGRKTLIFLELASASTVADLLLLVIRVHYGGRCLGLKALFLHLVLASNLGASLSHAVPDAEIEHVSDTKVKELEQLFSIGTPAEKNRMKSLHESLWSCDLFGVRSRMQVIRGAKLYSFVLSGDTVQNSGSQEVKLYQIQKGELQGDSRHITDHIRFLSRNHLIARMTTKAGSPETVAFATCKSL
jgi:hypothetical protein